MQVYRAHTPWSSEEQPFHLIEKKGWLPALPGALPVFEIQTWCDKKYSPNLKKGDDYTEYVREKHRKSLCKTCVQMIKLASHGRRS